MRFVFGLLVGECYSVVDVYLLLFGVFEYWDCMKFGYDFIESIEWNGDDLFGLLFLIFEYWGVELNICMEGQQVLFDVLKYCVVWLGQLVVNMMWFNYGGLGVLLFIGYISLDYKVFWILDCFEFCYVYYFFWSFWYIDYFVVIVIGVCLNVQCVMKMVLDVILVLLLFFDEQIRIVDEFDEVIMCVDVMLVKVVDFKLLFFECCVVFIIDVVMGKKEVV